MKILHNDKILILSVKDAFDFFWFNPDIERYFYCYLDDVKIARFSLSKDDIWGYELLDNDLVNYDHIEDDLYYFQGFNSSISLIYFIIKLLKLTIDPKTEYAK